MNEQEVAALTALCEVHPGPIMLVEFNGVPTRFMTPEGCFRIVPEDERITTGMVEAIPHYVNAIPGLLAMLATVTEERDHALARIEQVELDAATEAFKLQQGYLP